MTRTLTIVALTAALATSGCLQKDTTSTMYLRTDGSFDWVVLERDVRSDEADAATRDTEERRYLDAVGRDRHDVAEAFRALGGQGVRTRLLRDTRPYAVMVDAGFDSLSAVFDSQLAGCGVDYDISQTVEGGVTTWRLWADIGEDGNRLDTSSDTCGAALIGLSDALDLTVVLQSGMFTKAEGFTLKGADTAALDEEAGEATLKANHGLLVLSLSWSAAR